MMRRIYLLLTIVVMVAVGYLPTAAAAPAWQEEWEKVLAAAKKEGTVSMIGLAGSRLKDSLTLAFEKKYGIKVEYSALRGSEIGPKVSVERKAGKFLWDICVGGPTSPLLVLLPGGMLDPIEPALILPDVKDPKHWRGGRIEYLDAGKHILMMMVTQRGTLVVNPKVVKPDSINSYKDLLNPKFKQKIVMDDPTMSGPGQATFMFFYMHPELGPNFIRALAKQEPMALRDWNQELEGVAREKYLVLIGIFDTLVEDRIATGVPLAVIDPRKIKEGSDTSSNAGAVSLFNRAPHPNAAKVYINWLLSKEVQTDFARMNHNISTRSDVPTDHAPRLVPIPNSIDTYKQHSLDIIPDMLAVFKEAGLR